jgi:Zn-finger protein
MGNLKRSCSKCVVSHGMNKQQQVCKSIEDIAQCAAVLSKTSTLQGEK